ncbi:TIGR03745 family integrating conjugative element membrane protein [Pseudomonas vanderleydeniana]|uniref:TIGR03745 family integrating conjugative element membrane protein n=1 Tax=Pseudomonas vanderleydeniana TaxID=2745495 RepID=A0A9E6PSH0_9PSED|nr:TIGR03745 family integrating conjugative element membrane protein [Pseudomonas vanderleydeniana]QXI31186.1 TIGR03745 family integrating conjugative element membrane protein [Pseudomonas vanderleydeniana]
MNIQRALERSKRSLSRLLLTGITLWSGLACAGLPSMEAPSRGDGRGIIETLQNYGYDIVALIALAISAAAFCGVAYHAYSCYSEVQTGKKTWGQFGLTCGVGALLLVIVIWLLTKGTGVL